MGNVRPFVLGSGDQFLPDPPPSLGSPEWVDAFNQVKAYGAVNSSVRTADETAVAKFWSANVIRQENTNVREIAAARGLDLLQTARLAAMVNVIASDAQISVHYAKYHYLFWRPVTAINGSLDPTAVTTDGFGPVPGFDDGNPATVEQAGWRPLLSTPNHPEYPSAHCALTSAMVEVFSSVLGSHNLNLDFPGFDGAGAAGNFNAVRHFATADDLVTEVVNARVWAGVHYRFSDLAGVSLGRSIARYDLGRAFKADDLGRAFNADD